MFNIWKNAIVLALTSAYYAFPDTMASFRYPLLSAFSPTSDLWCPEEPNNVQEKENAVDILYYTEKSSLFCLNDDASQRYFSTVCELKHRKKNFSTRTNIVVSRFI